jgi:glycosyltransferase involved in cell wall biosynthesis
MNVLIVTPFPILPLSHGARVRTYGLATGLARAGATVHLLFPWQPGLPRSHFYRDGITCHPHTWVANIAPAILGDRLLPPLVALSWQPLDLGPVQLLRRLGHIDVVQFEFCSYPGWMERLRGSTKIVYSAHNVEFDFAGAQVWPPIVRGPALRRLAALELRAVHAADLLLTCTQADSGRMAELYGTARQTEVIPHGFDAELMAFERNCERERARASFGLTPDQRVLLFVGGRARHNCEAARFLARQLAPQLGSGVQFLLVGECCRGRDMLGSNVRTLGFVRDLRPLYAAADVGVNPVTYGSGASVKVIEYLAAGLPVVSTAVGIRGYERLSARFRIAELDDFAAAIAGIELTLSPATPALREFSWTTLAQRLHRTYKRLTDLCLP